MLLIDTEGIFAFEGNEEYDIRGKIFREASCTLLPTAACCSACLVCHTMSCELNVNMLSNARAVVLLSMLLASTVLINSKGFDAAALDHMG